MSEFNSIMEGIKETAEVIVRTTEYTYTPDDKILFIDAEIKIMQELLKEAKNEK